MKRRSNILRALIEGALFEGLAFQIMRTRFFLALVIALFVAGCGRGKHAGPADYPIKLYRPQPVGSEHRMVVTGSFEDTADVNSEGKSRGPKIDSYTLEIDATIKVLSSDPDALGPISQLTIAKATKTKDGKTEEFLSVGTVVVEKRSADKTEFFLGDSAVNATAAYLLQIGELSAGLDPRSDETSFGTQDRKRVGDSWPINAGAAAAYFTRLKMACKPGNIVGSATLKEVSGAGNEMLLTIVSTTSINDIRMELPAGFTLHTCNGKMTSTSIMPVEAAKLAKQGSLQMEINAIFDRQVSGKTITVTVFRKASIERKLLEK